MNIKPMPSPENNLRILTWNLGLFSWAKYARYFGIKLNDHKINNEYFQKVHLGLIVENILNINPDICVLQELFLKEDSDLIIERFKNEYKYNTLIDTWYHEHSILILSKNKIDCQRIINSEFYLLKVDNLSFIPIHLNSFYPSKRLSQVNELVKYANENKVGCILGDTNIWCLGKKPYFIFKNDRKAYKKLMGYFTEATQDVGNTIKIFGMNFDKIFLSKNMVSKNAECIKINGQFMDHYPVFIDVHPLGFEPRTPEV